MLLLVNYSSAAQCKTFVCKTFETSAADECVYVDTAESSQQLVRECSGSKSCSALAWFSVDQATENATCADAPDPVVNMTVPGDTCDAKSECFGLDNETSCAGTCATQRKAGDFCENTGTGEDAILGTKWCNVGEYCDTDNKQCVAQLAADAVCTAAEQCSTGYGCIKVLGGETEEFKCTSYWTLNNGTKFDGSLMRQGGLLLNTDDACKSHHHIQPDETKLEFECRMAPVSTGVSKESDLKRPDGPSDDCKFTAYDDPENPDTAQEKTDTAKCGFNQDGAAYCDKRKGDSWFQKVLGEVQKKDLSNLKCHALSGLTTCGAAAAALGTSIYKDWVREVLTTDESGAGYALYADNANCVGKSMTNEYWQDDSPNFGFSSLTMSSLATIVLTISALFYMF